MRYVDIRKLQQTISKEWLENAEKTRVELLKKSPEERSQYIKDNAEIWNSIRQKLDDLSHGKCWYCETKPDGNAYFDVDHFRPKGQISNYENRRVKEGGYWWLAFDYTNFRLACIYCNRSHKCEDTETRGKATYFPLCNGSNKCVVNEDESIEKPILLDPADPLDPALLWFDEEGKAVPVKNPDSGEAYERAKKTIHILNLNNIRSKEHRRLIKSECDLIIKEGDEAIDLLSRNPAEGQKKLRSVLLRAKDIISDEAPFSRAAKVYLLSGGNVWVEEYLKRI